MLNSWSYAPTSAVPAALTCLEAKVMTAMRQRPFERILADAPAAQRRCAPGSGDVPYVLAYGPCIG